MKRVIVLVLGLLLLLAGTTAFAGQAELSDIQRPVDAWLYTGQ